MNEYVLDFFYWNLTGALSSWPPPHTELLTPPHTELFTSPHCFPSIFSITTFGLWLVISESIITTALSYIVVNSSNLFYPTIDILKKNSKDIQPSTPKFHFRNKQWPNTLYEIIYDTRIKHMYSKRFEWRLCHCGIWCLQK